MSLTEKNYGFSVGNHWVEVQGRNKAIHPKWSLIVDENVVDTITDTGKILLSTTIDNNNLEVLVNQGNFGDVKVKVMLGGKKIQEYGGFLA